MVRPLIDLWAGRVPLARAFWGYAICWGFLINIVATILALALVVAGAPNPVVLAVHLAPIPWNVLVVVGVWRSAGSADVSPGWAIAARVASTAWTILLTAA
jgi:hypothetical protein